MKMSRFTRSGWTEFGRWQILNPQGMTKSLLLTYMKMSRSTQSGWTGLGRWHFLNHPEDETITAIQDLCTKISRDFDTNELFRQFDFLKNPRQMAIWFKFTNLYDHNQHSGCGVCFHLLEEVLQFRPTAQALGPLLIHFFFCSALPSLLIFKYTTVSLTIKHNKKDHIFIIFIFWSLFQHFVLLNRYTFTPPPPPQK